MTLSHFFESSWQFEFDNFAPADFPPVEARGNVVVCHGPLVRAFSTDGEVLWTLQESPNMGSSAIFERTDSHLYFEYKNENRVSVVVEADHTGSVQRQFELASKVQRFGSAQRDGTVAFISSSKVGSTLHILTDGDSAERLIGFATHGITPAKDGWIVRNQYKGAVLADDAGDVRVLSDQPTWDAVAAENGPFGLLTGTKDSYRFALHAHDGTELRGFEVASPFATQTNEHVFIVVRRDDKARLTAIDWRGELVWEVELGDVDNYRLWAASGWLGVARLGGFQMFQAADGELVGESRLTWAAPLVIDESCFWIGSSTVVATAMKPSE